MRPLSVLYDADCGFCRWSLAGLLRLDRDARLLPVAIQSEQGARLLAPVPAERRLRSAHVVTPEGRVASGGAAVRHVARVLGGPAPALVARIAEPALHLGYGAVAGNRRRLGRFVGAAARDAATQTIERHRARVLGTAGG